MQKIDPVAHLGFAMGYGALMHRASELWKQKLMQEHNISDGHFVAVGAYEIDNLKKEVNMYKEALSRLLNAIQTDKDGDFVIWQEAAPLVDRCQAIVDGKATDFSDID